jgi:prepilin-type N-terminal cleavage/methylation domain-containing protein
MNKKGFTLIELLVVIAIIGILSGTVVVSMSGAQGSAKDARIKSAMDQLRSVAELHRISQSPMTYVGFTGSTDGLLLVADINSQSPGSLVAVDSTNVIASAYCMSIGLNSGDTLCMDSTGKIGSVACGSATACPN